MTLIRLIQNSGTNKTLSRTEDSDNFTVPIRLTLVVCPFGKVTMVWLVMVEWEKRERLQQTWCVAPVSIIQAS